MAEAPDIATSMAMAPAMRAAPPHGCPRCDGRLRFDREIPCGGTIRRYDRCTGPGCDFECVRLAPDRVTTPGAIAGAP